MASNEMVAVDQTDRGAPPVENEDSENSYVPDGWESAEAFLEYARKCFDADAGYDRKNRDWALEDLKFLAGDQWDKTVKADRIAMHRPCLTINVLPQFVGQVIGDRRINKTAIKVTPKKNASVAEAEIRAAIIKGIEHTSRADRVYDAVCEDQVACGISAFRIDLDYAANDVFEQDIVIRHIPNPLAVIWDRMSIDPTGRDAKHCFVNDTMPTDIYKKNFPKHPNPSELGDDVSNQLMSAGWFDKDVVRLTEFWEMIEKPATFALMADGDVKDVTGRPRAEYETELWRHPQTGATKIRQGFRTYARMHLITGFAILTEAYELPLDRLPIIRIEGRVVRVGEDRVRFGLVRYAKDSQRLKNYWRSVAAETLALAPKAQWVGTDKAFEGREDEWRDAHRTGDPLMIFNSGADKPDRVDPPQVPAALLQEAQMNQQDIKDTTGLQDASLGIRSNEVSGRAIESRKAEGDVATVVYHDNVNAGILEGGDVINQLLPIAFDTMREMLTIGEDDKRKTIVINDPEDDESPNITAGRYSVSLDTGPSFATQRNEARESMNLLLQTAPDLFGIAGDLFVKYQDWPGAHEISERLHKMMVKNGVIEPDEEDLEKQTQAEPSQQEQAAMAMQQMQAEEMEAQLEHAKQMREAELVKAREDAKKAQADAEKAKADARAAKAKAMQEDANARRAFAEAKQADAEAKIHPVREGHKLALTERSATVKDEATRQRGAGSRPEGDRPAGRKRRKKPNDTQA